MLLRCKQREGESLRDYLDRFSKETADTTHQDSLMEVTGVMEGLRDCPFLDSITGAIPRNFTELMSRAQEFIATEEFKAGRREEALQMDSEFQSMKSPEPIEARTRGEERAEAPREVDRGQDRPPRRDDQGPLEPRRLRFPGRYNNYTPLNTTRENVFMQIQSKKILKQPDPLKESGAMKRSKKYCSYHQVRGHTTEDCIHLRDAIEELVRAKKLDQFLLQQQPEPEGPQPGKELPPKVLPLEFISGGPGCGGESLSSRKNYARMVGAVQELAPLKRSRSSSPISFSNEDLRGVSLPHDDALVVAFQVGAFMMYRILVDTGSSVDIIFWDAFERMGIGAENLRPTRSPLKGFNGDPLCPEGVITLPVVLGEAPRTVSASANFLVVRCSSSYNAIMGRPLLHMLAAVPSSYHMKLKFHTERGMGEVRGDQPASRRCYLTALKDKGGESSRASEALALEGLDPEDQEREARRPTPVEKLKVLPLLEGDPVKTVQLGG
ncbi:hypothetical protein J5N97_016244 [Dioscorea zingiberensis]|uniref:Retrotransposon gag domain-containing protein n=1 Tax=Dioscorea zingiberensis TaxID=325984 RepID=A0A9D5CJX1_9LILI|nr:hypothetical protein J5N97_016244 [Dioscorea zingiberensis]